MFEHKVYLFHKFSGRHNRTRANRENVIITEYHRIFMLQNAPQWTEAELVGLRIEAEPEGAEGVERWSAADSGAGRMTSDQGESGGMKEPVEA